MFICMYIYLDICMFEYMYICIISISIIILLGKMFGVDYLCHIGCLHVFDLESKDKIDYVAVFHAVNYLSEHSHHHSIFFLMDVFF
jgi:hypothetical protein